jgi:hypothetical protein
MLKKYEKRVIFMQKTIKFNDFMSKKHHIIGLTQQEQQFADSFKHLFFILVALAVGVGLPFPIPSEVETAFLYV